MPVLLEDILVILFLSVVVISLTQRLSVPPIVGFLLTGVLAGPHGFRLIHGVHEVEALAETGVVLLLFTIGMEFSLARLIRIGRVAILGGALQVGGTIAAVVAVATACGLGAGEAVFLGCMIALSSTAVVLKLLQQRGETTSPAGRVAVAILIAQDIIVVPMMLAVPFLAGTGGSATAAIFAVAAKAALVIGVVYAGIRWAVPALLGRVVRMQSRELFLLSILLVCSSVVGLSAVLGLSLALGAFLAGLMISETDYSHQAFGNVIPFRDVFASFFFVSIGMLLDANVFLVSPLIVAAMTITVVAGKAVVTAGAGAALGVPLRVAVQSGVALAQIGEFSFVLAGAGLGAGLLDPGVYQLFLAAAVLSLAVTPVLIPAAPRIGSAVAALPWPDRFRTGRSALEDDKPAAALRDHLVIVGFGFTGHNLARAARAAGIAYSAIEMNTETVRRERAMGEPVVFGDATEEVILEHSGAREARVAVVAISDPPATARVVAALRRVNPALHVIVRTRYLAEAPPLREAGATEVVPEELESAVEIFVRVLARYLIPRDVVQGILDEVRRRGYEMLADSSALERTLDQVKRNLPGVEIHAVTLAPGAEVAGWTLAELDLRRVHAVTLLAIRREGGVIENPAASEALRGGDVLYLMGRTDAVYDVLPLFEQ
jgi:CPA2 family monovalent cation:H+ antiporter-2